MFTYLGKETLASKILFGAIPLRPLLSLKAIDSKPFQPGQITHKTAPIDMAVGVVHWESACFYVISFPYYSIVLSQPLASETQSDLFLAVCQYPFLVCTM